MPALATFDDVMQETKNQNRTLLIGNGFSAKYFNYKTLLAESGLEEGTPLRKLFSELSTADFEAVIRALESAVIVERAYCNKNHADELNSAAQKVREALVRAVNKTHPLHRNEMGLQLGPCSVFIANFCKFLR